MYKKKKDGFLKVETKLVEQFKKQLSIVRKKVYTIYIKQRLTE